MPISITHDLTAYININTTQHKQNESPIFIIPFIDTKYHPIPYQVSPISSQFPSIILHPRLFTLSNLPLTISLAYIDSIMKPT